MEPIAGPGPLPPTSLGRGLLLSARVAAAASRPGRVRSLADPRLDRLPHLRRQVRAVEPVDLLHARGRGHVDLGQELADHVDADEYQPRPLQRRAQRLADLLVAPREPRLLGPAADVQVGPRLAAGRDAVHGTRG